jgi:transcriptional regulator with XRE-family HTH domain
MSSHGPRTRPRLRAEARRAARTGRTPDLLDLFESAALDAERKARIARRLRELRDESPYTQEAIARKLHMSLRAYQKIEATGGTRYPNLEALADIYEVPVESLWEDPDEPQAPADVGERLDRIEKTLGEVLALLHQHDGMVAGVVSSPGGPNDTTRRLAAIEDRQFTLMAALAALLPSEDQTGQAALRAVDALKRTLAEADRPSPSELPSTQSAPTGLGSRRPQR